MNKFTQKITQKNPAIVGFFAFFIPLILWLWTLQLLSHIIFIFHKNNGIGDAFGMIIPAAYHGFALDLAWMAYLLIATLFVVIISMVFGKKWILKIAFVLLSLIAIVTCIISFADAELFHAWGSKFNAQALQFLKHPKEAVASSSEASWLSISIITFFSSLLFIVWLNKIFKKLNTGFSYRFKTGIAALIALVFFAPLVRGGFQTVPINQNSAYHSQIPLHNAAAVNSCWNAMFYLVEKDNGFATEYLKFNLQNDAAANHYFAQKTDELPLMCNTTNPNVVVVILESFSSHTSAFFGNHFKNTPFLDSLAGTGLAFTRAYAQGDRTAKGLAAVLSGWPGNGNKTSSILTLPEKGSRLPGIAKVASQNGYQTQFVYGGDMGFDKMKSYVLSTGYQRILSEEDFAESEKGSKWGVHDGFVFARAIDSISKLNEPFFSTILTLSSHEPFEIPGKANTGNEVARFLHSVSYTDHCIKQFITAAKSKPWFQNTVFVFVADHGRSMGLPDMAPHQPKFYEIPIVFWGVPLKAEFKGSKQQHVCSQSDIPATICEGIFGVNNQWFPYSRNVLKPHPGVSYYQFWDGFGVVDSNGHVVWNNQNASVTENSGNTYLDLLNLGKAFQYRVAKSFDEL